MSMIDSSAAAFMTEGERGAYEMAYRLRPSVLFRPSLSIDGNQWCALYGTNLQDGVAGFGDTPEAAMKDFDAQWRKALPPAQAGSDT